MGKAAFVTGGTGFLGVNLVEQLTSSGWDVTALHRASSDLTYLKRFPVELVEGSIEDAVSLGKAMPEGLDAVFHVAADVNFWSRRNAQQTRTNIDGTRNVIAATRARGARRLVYTSTMGVYGFQASPVDEASPKLGKNSWINYLRTKAIAEEIVLEAVSRGLDAVLLNPSNIVGRYDKGSWGRMFRMILEGALPGVPNGRGSFCSVGEVARAHITAFDRGTMGHNYLLGGAEATYHEVASIVAELLGKRPPRAVPAAMLRVVGRLSQWGSYVTNRAPEITPEMAAILGTNMVCRSDKAQHELGYQALPVRTMLEDCHRWLESEGLLRAA
jgi:dihydroflavonol-4-reductase